MKQICLRTVFKRAQENGKIIDCCALSNAFTFDNLEGTISILPRIKNGEHKSHRNPGDVISKSSLRFIIIVVSER